ncbi:MAG: ABC transporter permease [Cryobacterium sp.]
MSAPLTVPVREIVTTPRENPPDWRRRLLRLLADKGIFAFTALVVLAALVLVSGFASTANIIDVFHRASAIGIVAVGMTFVVISANYIDLSVVAQVAIAGVALMAFSSYGLITAMAIGIGLCLVFGLVNGFAVGVLRANSVVVTLGTTGIGLGTLALATKGTIYYGEADGVTAAFGAARLGVLPYSALVLVLVAVVAGLLLSKTIFGFSLRSLGSNREAARLVGIRSGQVIIGAFLVTSVCAAIAGFVLASYSNTAVATMSAGFDFSALAAVIVGGNSLFGGKGSIMRTLVGVIFIAVVSNVLVLIGLTFEWQQFVTGTIIVVAVALDALSRKAGLR